MRTDWVIKGTRRDLRALIHNYLWWEYNITVDEHQWINAVFTKCWISAFHNRWLKMEPHLRLKPRSHLKSGGTTVCIVLALIDFAVRYPVWISNLLISTVKMWLLSISYWPPLLLSETVGGASSVSVAAVPTGRPQSSIKVSPSLEAHYLRKSSCQWIPPATVRESTSCGGGDAY